MVAAIAEVKVGQNAPGFQLGDQFNKTWKHTDLKGKVVVLIVADKHSGRAMGPWVEKLKAQYPNKIQILGMLDLHSVPGIGRGIAKKRIRNETKEPMMLDFQGKTAKAHEVTSTCPVVIVMDKDGVAKACQKSSCTPAAYKSVTDAVDAALKPKKD